MLGFADAVILLWEIPRHCLVSVSVGFFFSRRAFSRLVEHLSGIFFFWKVLWGRGFEEKI